MRSHGHELQNEELKNSARIVQSEKGGLQTYLAIKEKESVEKNEKIIQLERKLMEEIKKSNFLGPFSDQIIQKIQQGQCSRRNVYRTFDFKRKRTSE